MTNKKVFIGVGIFVILCSLAGILYYRSSEKALDKIVAKVGSYPVTKRDVGFRNEVIQQYFPLEARQLGREQLIRFYAYAEILNRYHMPVTQEVLLQESLRIDKNTKMPDKLEAMKAIFKSDSEAYRRVFVLPVYVERVLYYDLFLKHPKIKAQKLKDFTQWVEKEKETIPIQIY